MAFCIRCGKQIPDTVKFCPYCGSAVQVPQPIEEPPAEPKKKGGLFQNKPILFGCIGAGAALLLGILFCIYWFFLRPADRADAYTMYLQDDQLFMVNVADGDPLLLGEAKNGDEAYRGLVAASDDHTVAYFPQDIDLQAKTFSLCFRHTKRAGETPIVLSRDVTRYTLIEGGMIPVYLTKDGTLNCHSLSINRKLADRVADFRAAKDGSYFYYISNDQKLYYIADYGSPMILDGGVTALCHLSEDGATIIYTKGSALYRRINCGDPELLSANCLSFVGVLANGDVVYLRAAEGDKSYYSFINDTNAVADAAFKEPQAPTPPNLEEIANETEYVAAQGVYNKALSDYQKATQDYAQKLARDQLRNALQSETPTAMQASLCTFKNGTEAMLAECCGEVTLFPAQNAVFYQNYLQDTVSKKELSDFEDAQAAKTAVDEAIAKTAQWVVTVNERSVQLQAEQAEQFSISENGEIVYYISDPEGTSSLCRLPLNEGTAAVYVKQADTYLPAGEHIIFTRREGNALQLFCDGERLTDSSPAIWFALPDGVCYQHNNALFTYQNGTETLIAENIDMTLPLNDGYHYIS